MQNAILQFLKCVYAAFALRRGKMGVAPATAPAPHESGGRATPMGRFTPVVLEKRYFADFPRVAQSCTLPFGPGRIELISRQRALASLRRFLSHVSHVSLVSHNALVPLSLSSLCPCALREDAGNRGGQITAGGERSDAITRFEVNQFRDVPRQRYRRVCSCRGSQA